MMQAKLLAIGFCCFSLSCPLLAVTYCVAPPAVGGDDDKSGLDWGAPKASLSNALAQGNVTEILVSNGTYNLTATVTNNKAVVIRSFNAGAVDRAGTIIDGGGKVGCLYLNNAGAVVDGLTITGGYISNKYGRGAGVYIYTQGGMLTNCLITNNYLMSWADYYGGGGVCMLRGSMWNCRITGNTVTNSGTNLYRESGAGVLIVNSGLVAQCEIDGNHLYSAQWGGGGVAMATDGAEWPGGVVRDCGISNNVCLAASMGGGGMYVRSCGMTTNCIIAGNNLLSGRGGGIYQHGSSNGLITVDCVISNNTSASYGGGIYINGSNTLLRGQVVNNTSGNSGGGVMVEGGRVEGVCVAANEAPGASSSGGGIVMWASSNNYVFNCIVSNNSSGADGGGVLVRGGRLDACEIVSNECNGANVGGGGVYVYASVNSWVLNCTVRCNSAKSSGTWGGGGIAVYSIYDGYVDNCLIEGNRVVSGYGGGIALFTNATVKNCRILGNTTMAATRHSGGVYIHSFANGTILQNCLIAGNTSQYFCSGGIYVISNFDGEISGCTIVDNEVRSATADRRGAGIYINSANNIFNCIICSNRWVTPPPEMYDYDVGIGGDLAAGSNSFHYCLAPRDLPAGQGNINGAALFRDDAWHLLSGSPGINAGTNQAWMLEAGAADLDGRPRLDRFSRRVDMGCYEHIFQGAMFNVR